MSDPDVISLEKDADCFLALDALGRSFAGDETHPAEPVQDWMLATTSLKHGHEHRVPYITFAISADRLPYLKVDGGILVTRDADSNIAAVVHACKVKKPLNSWSIFNMIRTFITLGTAKRLPELVQSRDPETKATFKLVNKEVAARGKALGNIPKRLHTKHGPRSPHYYITFVAVEPGQQGMGHCSKLLKAIHRIADAENAACYLDCGSERNTRVYAKLGYAIVAQETVTITPGDVLTIYAMVREATQPQAI